MVVQLQLLSMARRRRRLWTSGEPLRRYQRQALTICTPAAAPVPSSPSWAAPLSHCAIAHRRTTRVGLVVPVGREVPPAAAAGGAPSRKPAICGGCEPAAAHRRPVGTGLGVWTLLAQGAAVAVRVVYAPAAGRGLGRDHGRGRGRRHTCPRELSRREGCSQGRGVCSW